jgi:hypothetical protein
MSKFNKSLLNSEQHYLEQNDNMKSESTRRTDDIFKQYNHLLENAFASIANSVKKTATGLDNKLNIMKKFNKNVEAGGLISGIAGAKKEGKSQPDAVNTGSPATAQPTAAQPTVEQLASSMWQMMDPQDKQLFADDVNQYIAFTIKQNNIRSQI